VKRPRIILADDHPIVAEGLRGLLASRGEVIAVVADGLALLQAARSLEPDVIVADISMPGVNGIEVTLRLRREDPQIKVVILTMHREEGYVRRALEAGVAAYVLKVSAPDDLLTALDAVLAGRTYVSPELDVDFPDRAHRRRERPDDPASLLTSRQREILQLLAAGQTAKEIAAILGISARTVESHKYEAMRALGCERSAELVQFAVRHGFVEE
jgi:DNA-binding NarL/FixJ family response regulator